MDSFSLLETMRLETGGISRLERHLSRMANSAAHFGYPWNEAAVRQAIAVTVAAYGDGSWRLRLLLTAEGQPTVECTPHVQDSRGPWRVAFALEPIDPDDPFILNKTTRRQVYDSARRSRADVDDVLLWNSRGDVTESTIGNVVAEIDGTRYTPPVASGLLAGTFRAEQLEAGTIRERVLTKPDVASASRLWIINSLREWVEVTLVN